MEPMYPGIPNSPKTELTTEITAVDTTITVANGDSLPAAPNFCTIGIEEMSETVFYAEKNGNVLSQVTRSVQGVPAQEWRAGTKVARNFTEADYAAMMKNIKKNNEDIGTVSSALTTHTADTTAHGATSDATPNRIVTRDTNGQFKVGAPTDAAHVARKQDIPVFATKAQAEAGTDIATIMSPQQTKQYVDTRLQGDLTLRYNDGNVEAYNGTEWVSVGGDPTLSNYFGQYGTFPFAGDQDVTISSNTTWDDEAGYRKVKKLTIGAGVTLRINKSPFVIFAEEIIFESATSVISADGLSGSITSLDDYLTADTPVGGISVYSNKLSAGGCGGGFLLLVSKKITGSGKVSANGGRGAFNLSVTAQNRTIYPYGAFSKKDVLTGRYAGDFVTTDDRFRAYLHPLGVLMGNGGGDVNGLGTGGGNGGGTNSGGSGVGGGGGFLNGNPKEMSDGKTSDYTISPLMLLELLRYNCRGGGGGSAGGGGGGGGAVGIWVRQLSGSPVLEANGGIAAISQYGDGAAGVTHLVKV